MAETEKQKAQDAQRKAQDALAGRVAALKDARTATLRASAQAGLAQANALIAQCASDEAHREAYMAAINAIPLAWNNHNIGQVQGLLDDTQKYAQRGFEWYYWQQMCHQEQRTLYGHNARINAVVVSPDGSRIASGGYDKRVRLWDADSGVLLASWPSEEVIWSLHFSPDGKRLAIGTDSNTPRILDARTGDVQMLLQGHAGGAWAVAFSPDGRRVATGSWDWTVRIWDAQTGRQIGEPLTGPAEGVVSLAWSPRADDPRLCAGSFDATAHVWDTRTRKEVLPPLRGHRGNVWCVAWSPDGKRIATTSRDSTVKLWDAATGREERTLRRVSTPVLSLIDETTPTQNREDVRTHELTGHTGMVLGAAFSPDSRRVLTTSRDNTAILWDADKGSALRVLTGHRDEVDGAAFFPDGKRVATAGADGVVKVWNALREGALHQLRGHEKQIVDVCASPDGKRFASASLDGAVMLWDADAERRVETLRLPDQRLWAARFTPDGRRLLTAGSLPDNTVRVSEWDLQSYKVTRSLPVFLNRHKYDVQSVRVSLTPDGSRLAVCAHMAEVCILDLRAWRVETVLPCEQLLCDVCFSPDGSLLAGAGLNETWVWDTRTGHVLRRLNAPGEIAQYIAFAPKGHLLATRSKAGVRVWDTRAGAEICALDGLAGQEGSLAFSPDGLRLAESGAGNTIRVVDARAPREVLSLPGCGGMAAALTFSSDGRRLAAGGTDGVLRVWNMASDAQVFAWENEKQQSLARVAALTTAQAQKERQRQVQLMREVSSHQVHPDAPGDPVSNLFAVSSGQESWRLNVNSGAVAKLSFEAGGVHVITQERGALGRDVTVSLRGLRLLPEHGYTLQFRARAKIPGSFALFTQNDAAPQAISGLCASVIVSPEWHAERFPVDITDKALPDHGMITFEFGGQENEVWLTDLMLVPNTAPPAPARPRTEPPPR